MLELLLLKDDRRRQKLVGPADNGGTTEADYSLKDLSRHNLAAVLLADEDALAWAETAILSLDSNQQQMLGRHSLNSVEIIMTTTLMHCYEGGTNLDEVEKALAEGWTPDSRTLQSAFFRAARSVAIQGTAPASTDHETRQDAAFIRKQMESEPLTTYLILLGELQSLFALFGSAASASLNKIAYQVATEST